MTRRGAAAVALTVAVGCGGSPLLAGRDGGKTIYACGTVPGTLKRVEGRVNTWTLSTLGFTPDSRVTKPLLIRYKSIVRIEYGRTPPRRVEAPITLRCDARWSDNHLMIFYKEPADDDAENQDPSQWKSRKEEEKEKARDKERANRAGGDRKDPDRTERRKRPGELQDPRERRLEYKAKEDSMRGVEHFAAFALGDGVRVATLRILETRSGRRIFYQDAAARSSAR